MAMRSVEFVGKAEGIKSHELSVKSLMEKLSGTLSSLKGQKRSLQSELSSLYAELAAAESDTDEDGEPDYGLIASIENQIDQTNEELSETEGEISQTSGELQRAQQEYAEVEEEKQQTLFEIQERARITSQDASKASGMFGAWASVGASLNQSFQANFDALAQAASILDGNVSAASAQTSSSGGGGGSSRTAGGIGIAAAGATAIASSGMIASTKPMSGSLGSKQISGANSPGGRFQYAKGGNANHKEPQLSSTQSSGTSVHSSVGASVGISAGATTRNSSFETSQSSHSSSNSGKSSMKGASTVTGYDDSISKETRRAVNRKTASSDVRDIQASQSVSTASPNAGSPMIARRGRNSFTDGLIVQDWELGRYSSYSLSSIRKAAADADYAAYIKNPSAYSHTSYDKKPIVYLDPATIKEIRGINDPNFWSYKSTSYSDYIDMARQIPLVYSMAKAGQKLTDLAKRNDVIGACARNYFLSEDITAVRVGNSFIFGGEGRHRVMAALIAGVNIPVRITDEFTKNGSEAVISKKQLEQLSEKEKASRFRQNFAEKSFTILEMIAKADKSELQSIVQNEQLAQKVDFGDLDINVARELVDTIRNAKNKYPFLDFPFIGATQSLNANLRQNIEASLTRLYVQNNPTASMDDIAESVKLQTEAYMSQFKIEDNDLAVSISVKTPQKIARPKPGMETAGYVTEYVGDIYSSKLNGISINAENAKDYSALRQDLEKEEARGASPKGCKSVNYLINHEIAHQLDHFLNLSSDPDIIREYKKHIGLTEKEQIDNVCTYASTDIHEFIAEAWAESQCSSTPRAVAKLIGEKVSLASDAYMKSKKGDDEYVREREI